MKIGEKITTLRGHKGVISQIEKIGKNEVITLEDRTRWTTKDIKIKKGAKK